MTSPSAILFPAKTLILKITFHLPIEIPIEIEIDQDSDANLIFITGTY
jgi:hypothetical protein